MESAGESRMATIIKSHAMFIDSFGVTATNHRNPATQPTTRISMVEL